MNKKLFFSFILMVMAAIIPARAAELTVYDGTMTNQYVPAFVYYWDDFTRAQTVIPAADLEYMNGGTISAIKFYTTASNIPYTSVSTAKVYLMEVNYTSISAFEPQANGTIVYDGLFEFVANAAGDGGEVIITFNAPYAYNGGNLLIGIDNDTDAGYKTINFYGKTVNGASISGYNASSEGTISPTQRNFIPKTTFSYSPGEGPIYYKPTNLAVSNITTNGAKVTWTPGSTETAWNVEYKKAADEDWTAEAVTGTPELTLDALENNTDYQVRVQADYGEGNLSSFTDPVSFTTLRCDDMGFITYNLVDSYGDGWNGASITVVDAATGEIVQTLTVTGSSNNGTIGICLGETYNFIWNSGSYDSECSMTITDPFGEEIYAGAAPSASQFASYTYQIITNPTPKNLAVDQITQTSAVATWEGEAEAYNLRYRSKGGFEKFYQEGFENGMGGWTVRNDGDGDDWALMKMTNYSMGDTPMTTADGGDYALASISVDADYNYIACDNWAISPQVDLKGTLKFFVSDLGADYVEHYSVYVSTTGTEVADFTPLAENVATPGGLNNWAEQSYDMSAYEGQQGYIAIRHQSSGTSGYYLFLDAVSLDGAEIPVGEWVVVENTTSPATMENLTPSTDYEVQVQAIYAEENSDWTASVDFTTLGMDEAPGNLEITEVTATTATAEWEGVQDAYNLRYRKVGVNADFEDSSMGEWTTIDADGDGYNWVLGSACGGVYLAAGGSLAGSGYSPNDLVTSGSYSNVSGVGALTPDNYLVSPKVELGGTITFWAKGQDASYAAEVFGVAVSVAGNTDPADFTMVGEKKTATGNWVEYTFDLSEYAGQQGYVAIRHYDCTDMFMLDVDDIVILPADAEWTVVENVTSPYTIENLAPETKYEAQVQGIFEAKATSDWSASVFFTTLEAPAPTPVITVDVAFGTYAEAQTVHVTVENMPEDATIVYQLVPSSSKEEWSNYDDATGIVVDQSAALTVAVLDAEGEELARLEGEYVIDTQTGIANIGVDGYDNNAWYNLNGQKLNGKPVTPGIYINGGKKVIIK